VDGPAKSPWTPLVGRPVAFMVVIAVVAPPAPAVVVVARAVVVVVVDALSPSSSLDGVPGVTVWPELTPNHDAVTATPSPCPCCRGGGGFGPCADGAPARPRSEHCRKAELSVCCATAASSRAFNCWRTHRSSEVAGSGQPRSSMAATARFWDARWKGGGASTSGLAFAPPLACQLLSGSGMRAVA
jgi:hypothetical protein